MAPNRQKYRHEPNHQNAKKQNMKVDMCSWLANIPKSLDVGVAMTANTSTCVFLPIRLSNLVPGKEGKTTEHGRRSDESVKSLNDEDLRNCGHAFVSMWLSECGHKGMGMIAHTHVASRRMHRWVGQRTPPLPNCTLEY
jgi:hypothetical protein